MRHFFATAAIFLFLSRAAMALPSLDAEPCESGDYAYYIDNATGVYVGTLAYDDATLALRYFDPKGETLADYLTLNPNAPSLEISGERFVPDVQNDNVDAANYLHSFLYDAAEARKKANGKVKKSCKVQSAATFLNADGDFCFEPFIPIFNLHKICDAKRKSLFELAAIGRVDDSCADEFFDFAGISFESPNSAKKSKSGEKTLKNAEQSKIEGKFAKFSLPADWQKFEGGLWAMGDDAMLLFSEFDSDKTCDADEIFAFCATTSLYSVNGFLTDARGAKIERRDGFVRIDSDKLNAKTKAKIHNVGVAVWRGRHAAFLSLEINADIWNANRAYFDKITRTLAIAK